jgi:hypothetical protein
MNGSTDWYGIPWKKPLPKASGKPINHWIYGETIVFVSPLFSFPEMNFPALKGGVLNLTANKNLFFIILAERRNYVRS